MSIHKYVKPEKLYKRVLEKHVVSMGKRHRNSIAHYKSRVRDYEESAEHYKEAREWTKATYGFDSSSAFSYVETEKHCKEVAEHFRDVAQKKERELQEYKNKVRRLYGRHYANLIDSHRQGSP